MISGLLRTEGLLEALAAGLSVLKVSSWSFVFFLGLPRCSIREESV